MILREYQQAALDIIEGHITMGTEKMCLAAPPSYGKTAVAGHLAKNLSDQGLRVLFIVNLTTLVQQTINTLGTIGVGFNVIAAEFDRQEFDHRANVTIAMQQTLFARIDRLEQYDVIIQDEMHLMYQTDTTNAIYAKVDPKYIVGLSGTPYDQQGYALEDVEMISTATISDLIELKYLDPIKVLVAKFGEDIDLSDASNGEYSEEYLDSKINNDAYNNSVVQAWKANAEGKKTIVFTTGINHAEALAKMFRTNGVDAYAYHSKQNKKDGKEIFEGFKDNRFPILVSMNKLIVGFDLPDIECGVACRPSRTRRVVMQGIMRIGRKHPEGKHPVLLDCAGWTSEHGFVTDIYVPPIKGDRKALAKAKELTMINVMQTIIGSSDVAEVTRDKVVVAMRTLEKQSQTVPSLNGNELLSLFQGSSSVWTIVEIAFEIQKRKTGQKYQKSTIDWSTGPIEEMMYDFPDYSGRIMRSVKTRLQNIVKSGKKVVGIHHFPKWLREQSPYISYIPPENDIDESDIPY